MAISLKKRYEVCTAYFAEKLPMPETELTHTNTYELLVAVILSAQCTDKRVNMVTPQLFTLYPSPKELSKATFDELFPLIKSISYPNNKTKHLIGMANMIMNTFNGEIPADRDLLTKLPGVGRKTANVVASVAFGGRTMPVDTHVFRVSQRLGLVTKSKTPLEVEKQLIKNVKGDLLHSFHHWLILHGRYTCVARTPKCKECGLSDICKYYEAEQKKLLKKQNTIEQ